MDSHVRRSDQTAIPAVLIGTGAWLVALVVVGLTVGVMPPASGVWWFGACMVGVVSGLIGLVFLRWRRSRMIRSGRFS
jgi:hypothetical protein